MLFDAEYLTTVSILDHS